jgi:glycosyltransferase involved in cell wall biosynthesis
VLEPDLSSVSKLRFRGADAVIACSRSVADHLSGCNPEVIYAGVETGDSAPAGPPQTGPIRLGVLSRLVPLKRIEAVVEVTARLAAMGIDVQTEICGKGPSEPGLRSLTEKLGMTERVRFLGWREDVGDLLASWHLVVLPSMTEGLGLAVLEAMAAGRTAVASRVGGLRELVVDGITGKLVPPGDTGALVECIAELARDRERLELMGAAAWERAHTHFSNDLMVQKTTGLYEHLLSRKG